VGSTETVLGNEIAGLDMARGLKRYGGDRETYIKILRSYAGSVRSVLETIETVDDGSLAGYTVKIHGVKGASYDIFADSIGRKAEALEHAARDGNLGFIGENNPLFLEDAGRLVHAIEEMLAAIAAENPKPKKDRPDDAQLSKLLAACKIYSMKKADEALAELDKYQYVADGGLVDWLRKNADVMNFTQIEERLSGLNLEENR
jgi:hypothetical protein